MTVGKTVAIHCSYFFKVNGRRRSDRHSGDRVDGRATVPTAVLDLGE